MMDIALRDAVIEELRILVREMAQAVPLRGDLRVEGPHVVVDGPRGLVYELPVERLALEERLALRLGIQGPI